MFYINLFRYQVELISQNKGQNDKSTVRGIYPAEFIKTDASIEKRKTNVKKIQKIRKRKIV